MRTNQLYATAAAIAVISLASSLSSHAQESRAASGSTSSSSQEQVRQQNRFVSGAPRKISEQELKRKVTKVNKASSFIGMTVKNLQDENLGKIEDLALDIDSGRVAYAVLSAGGFLGLNEKYIAVPLNSLMPAPGEDHLVLDANKERLQDAPGFAKNQWPDLDTPAWSAAAGLDTIASRKAQQAAVGRPAAAPQQQGTASQASSSARPPSQKLETAKTKGRQPESQRFSGTIASLDPASRSITVKGTQGEKKFNVDNNAQIRSGDKDDGKLDDLTIGSHVYIEYKQEGTQPVARVIEAQPQASQRDDQKTEQE